MRERYKSIYLSPHLDDAALSCGGRVFMQTTASHPILIVTTMAGEPAPNLQLSAFAQELHQRWALPQDAVRARRAEDAAACHILGADYLHWAVPDCVYRTDPTTGKACYPTWESVITTRHPADDAVVDHLVAQLRQLPPADAIVVPLTACVSTPLVASSPRIASSATSGVNPAPWVIEKLPLVEQVTDS